MALASFNQDMCVKKVLEFPECSLPQSPRYYFPQPPEYPLQQQPGYRSRQSPEYPWQQQPRYCLQQTPEYPLPRPPGYHLPQSPEYYLPQSPQYLLPQSSGLPLPQPFMPQRPLTGISAMTPQQQYNTSPIECAPYPGNCALSNAAHQPYETALIKSNDVRSPEYPHGPFCCASSLNTSGPSFSTSMAGHTSSLYCSPYLQRGTTHAGFYPHAGAATTPNFCGYANQMSSMSRHGLSSPVFENATPLTFARVTPNSLSSLDSFGKRKSKIESCRCPKCIEAEKTGKKKTEHICYVEGCGKIYKKTSHLKAHIRGHNGCKPYVCLTCRKSFTRSDELQRHNRIHTGDKKFVCSVCSKRFVRSDHHKKHEKTHEKKPQVPIAHEENVDVLNSD
uniref:Zinc finger transcription factor Sp5 n=1 Tax=Nymphon molleri TaxID=2138377 RepID=A0A2R4FYD0_9CHEL|nr:zinc finger transcription factor Sp5 [Nymphon molleri]